VKSEPTARSRQKQSWFNRNRSAIVRHAVINFFMVVILLPLAWVLMMSIKSLPDAMRGDFWPRKFDFSHYSFVFERIATLPVNLFNSIYVTAGTVLITTVCAVLAGYALVHLRPRGAGLVVTDQRHRRPHSPLRHAAAGDQHPDHAQHVPAGAA
jgi:ABC-type glycerol-3-phosphate transport system permease component